MLPAVEDAFTAAILPLLFADDCLTSVSVRRLRAGGQRRRLVATGVSSRPVDLILEGVECDPDNVLDTTNDCVTVSGEVTVFIDGDEADELATVNEVLEKGMTNDQFLFAHDSLVRITWDELFPVDTVIEELVTAAPTSAPTAAGSFLESINWMFLLIGVVVMMLLCIACAFLFRSKRQGYDANVRY